MLERCLRDAPRAMQALERGAHTHRRGGVRDGTGDTAVFCSPLALPCAPWMAARSANKAKTKPVQPPPWEALKYADVTLRAGEDGAEMRVHASYLMELSGVFAGLLSGDVALKDNVIPLPGMTAKELKLLCSFLCPTHSRFELVTLDNADTFCRMAQEYDMPRMLDTVEEGLVLQAEQLLDVIFGTLVNDHGTRVGQYRSHEADARRAAVSKRFRLLT